MHVSIKPDSSVDFEYSPRCTVTSSIVLTSVASGNIAFKVKTTAPKSYIVRPNQGVLLPNESKDLIITMQPLQDYPTEVNHRFLVRTAPTTLSPDQTEEIAKFWSSSPPDCIDSRLNVTISDSNRSQVSNSFISCISDNKTDRQQTLKNEIKDLKEFHDKQEVILKNKQEDLQELKFQQKNREDEINRVEMEGLKGYGTLHLIIATLIGMVLGYIYAISKSIIAD